jgi:peptidylprolyl isomerase domain and WD repeat-containing protein 1
MDAKSTDHTSLDEIEVGPPMPPPEHAEDDQETAAADVGPAPPKPKRRKVLEFEAQYLQALPLSDMYEKSYMHRDTVTQVAVAHNTDFFITGSIDGHIKFWKKQQDGIIEFAKHYKAHLGPVMGLTVSNDGTLCASISTDNSVKVFDVASFDMIAMLRLTFIPSTVEWCFARGAATASVAKLAIADSAAPVVHIFDARSGSNDAIGQVKVHSAPVICMRFNEPADAVISSDEKGFIEYWSAGNKPPSSSSLSNNNNNNNNKNNNNSTMGGQPESVKFETKLDTDLYCLAKAKTTAMSLDVSKDGTKFVLFGADRRIRILRYTTGKLIKTYDESLEASRELQKSGPEGLRLDPIDFGRRVAMEKQLVKEVPHGGGGVGVGVGANDSDAAAALSYAKPNAVFDESGNFILYPTMLGIKVVNLANNKVVKVVGLVEDSERFLKIALYQGTPAKSSASAAAASISSTAQKALPSPDPTIVACAAGKQRFYLFTKREPEADGEGGETGRDVFNERPSGEDREKGTGGGVEGGVGRGGGGGGGGLPPGPDLPRGAIIHTNKGDIWLKLFPDECPRTVENFTTHAKHGYYDNVIFHRVIKGFMIQTGDPLGDGTGGESIWGGEFEDEISRNLRHDRPYTLSMANAGPGTNGSQFFVTTVPTPWLDNKHTVFGRVVKGMDVVAAIEKVKVHAKTDRPLDDVRILNIEARQSVEG